MSKGKSAALSKEDQDYLASKVQGSQGEQAPKIPYLRINTSIQKDGKDILPASFNIYGTDLYKREVTFRPIDFYSKYERIVKVPANSKGGKDSYKTDAETVLYKFDEEPIDNKGTVACGRTFPVPENWTKEQREANNAKGKCIGVLFGIVDFGDGTAPTFVRLNLPFQKRKTVISAISKKSLDGKNFQNFLFKLKLTPTAQNNNPDFTMELVSDKELPFEDIIDSWKLTDAYVERFNGFIKKQHERNLRKSSFTSQADNLVDELDDDVPF
jgi:hypothetical protein